MATFQRERRQPMFEEKEWIPRTKLGSLVKTGKIANIDEIFRSSKRIREPEIVDYLLGKDNIKEDLISVKSVQKQSKAGQKTSMKVVAVVGNGNGYIGIGKHSSKELSISIKAAVAKAKMNIIPIRMGQWDGDSGLKHTIIAKSSGKCGSVVVRLIPAPVGTGIECSDVNRRIFELAGVMDIYAKGFGHTKSTGNLAVATYNALLKTSNYYIPEDWMTEEDMPKIVDPLIENADVLVQMDQMAFN